MADLQIGNAHGVAAVSPGVAQTAAKEVQSITVDATGGTFTATMEGNTTAALAYNITAGNLQTALNALTEDHDVVVTGGPGDAGGTTPYVVTFQSGGNVPLITTADSLTGGAGTAEVAVTTQGAEAYSTPPNLGESYADSDLLSLSAMRSRLATIDGTYYDTEKLNGMTWNDMVYAIRQNDNNNTFK